LTQDTTRKETHGALALRTRHGPRFSILKPTKSRSDVALEAAARRLFHSCEKKMAAVTYAEAIRRLLIHEGGYTNHPSDPGGPTNFGITIHDYRKYVKPGATAADVRAMKLDEAKAIYRAKYWNATRCDALPAGVDYAVFDYGVNSGIGRAGKVLRRVLKLAASTSTVTGEVAAAAGAVDAAWLVTAICDERLRFLKALRTWPVFGKGWGRRVAEVKAYALALARRGQAVPAPPAASAAGKGAVPVNASAQKGTAGGAIAAGGAAASQSSDATTILVIVVLTVALAAGAWAYWRWRQKQQQEAPTRG
jgi:lysozyme family protein